MAHTPNDYGYMENLENFLFKAVNDALDIGKSVIYVSHKALAFAIPDMPEGVGESAARHVFALAFHGSWIVVPDEDPRIGFFCVLQRSQFEDVHVALVQ